MAKKNNALIFRIGIWLGAIVFAAGGFYILVNFRLDAVEGDVNRIKETDLPNIEGDLDYQDDRLYETEKEIYGIKKDIGSLASKVDRNYKDQQKFQIEQRQGQKDILEGIKELHK